MRFRPALVLVLVVVACEKPQVDWQEPTGAIVDSTALPRDHLFRLASLPVDAGACHEPLTVIDGSAAFATWMSRRADSSIVLLASRSADSGRTWSRAGIVDSIDIARVGCQRPLPSIAAADGYVHIAYSLDAPEGYGVFFAHSMDGAATFHSPIPVIYGDRLSATAIAAQGMQVVVAYEDPSGTGHRIDVALSRTQGHSFEPRMHGSPPDMPALQPWIELNGSHIELQFNSPGGGRSARAGTIR